MVPGRSRAERAQARPTKQAENAPGESARTRERRGIIGGSRPFLLKRCVFFGQEVVEKSRHMLIDALCVWSLVRRLWKKQAHVD